jgi:hypothetical protein
MQGEDIFDVNLALTFLSIGSHKNSVSQLGFEYCAAIAAGMLE